MPLPHLPTGANDEAAVGAPIPMLPPLPPGAAIALLAIVRDVHQQARASDSPAELPDEAA